MEPFKKRNLRAIFGILAVLAGLLILLPASYFIFKAGATGEKISIENKNSSVLGNVGSLLSSFVSDNPKPLKGEEEGRINILLLGTAGKGKPGQNLTDTIMLASIDVRNGKASLFSLPRDFYAKIPETSYSTKINSIYQYGLGENEGHEPIKRTVEEIIGASVHYFVILNFDGFEKIIDDLGGINVSVERDIFDSRYPGPNYSYETFEIKKGLHLMDGKTALKYVRERHDDPEGDFGRAKRQQQVMQSSKNKIFSLGTFLNPIRLNNLLTDLGDNVKTDIGLGEIEGFVELLKKTDTQNIANVVADAWNKDSILKVSHVSVRGTRAFVLVPRVGNYSEIRDLFRNIFDLDSIKRRKTEIEKENAGILIINQSGRKNLGQKVKEILENKLGISKVEMGYGPDSEISARSLVYDGTNGKKIFTLDEIIKKLDVELGKDYDYDGIIGENSDLILVLGSDLENIDIFEEGNIEEFKKAEEKQEYFELIKK